MDRTGELVDVVSTTFILLPLYTQHSFAGKYESDWTKKFSDVITERLGG